MVFGNKDKEQQLGFLDGIIPYGTTSALDIVCSLLNMNVNTSRVGSRYLGDVTFELNSTYITLHMSYTDGCCGSLTLTIKDYKFPIHDVVDREKVVLFSQLWLCYIRERESINQILIFTKRFNPVIGRLFLAEYGRLTVHQVSTLGYVLTAEILPAPLKVINTTITNNLREICRHEY